MLLAEQGGKVIAICDTERFIISEKVKKVVWPKMRNDIGMAFDKATNTIPSP